MKKLDLHHLIFFLVIIITTSSSQETYCGSIKLPNNSDSSILKHMILCKSEKLYFRTSIGLFPVSSINYTNKILTVSHTSCSSSTSNFLSPHHLSAGFPPPPTPNSVILFNCANQTSKKQFLQSCSEADQLSGCNDSSAKGLSSCSVIEDVSKLEKGFHPKEMKCTHYSAVHRSVERLFEVGTRISFDIPDHVPNPCDECEKRDGNCGAGLRCVCYPKKCKDKVISGGNGLNLYGNMHFYYLVLFIVVMGLFEGF